MSFKGHDAKHKEAQRVHKFLENMRAFDQLCLDEIVKRRQEWFDDDKKMSKETAEAIYDRLLRRSVKERVNKTTKEAYPPCIEPKVNWIDGQWIMTLALPQEFKISFYSSPNLKEWTHLSDFGPAAEIGGIWECPDLFKLGDKWVLIVSLNPGGFQIGSGTQYFVGQWNGKEFIADDVQTRWIDYGRDNYAGVTFSNAPDNKRIFLGWMSNWDYAVKVPTDPWRSAMTVPRELSLKGNTLVQTPIEKPGGFPEVSFTTSNGAIRIHENADRYAEIGVRDGNIYVDTTHAWNEIAAPLVQEVPAPTTETDFRVIVDRGSIEVFAAGGTVVLTNLVLVDTALHYVETVGAVNNLKLQQLSLAPQG